MYRFAACLAGTCALALVAAPGAGAATMTFGSSLAVPATLDTAANLAYAGYTIPTISNGQAVYVHVNHDAADSALWNEALAGGSPSAPADGQIVSVRLEGCAKPAPGGPPPATQIHFQDLVPEPGGGAQVDVTTQPFDIPVCGAGGAGASTVTSYEPTNFCVHEGDHVDFNDEGGFDPANPSAYPSGVPYQVIGSVGGSTMDSFIANSATGNGAVFSPGVSSARGGFAANHGEELMLQATLATGHDATPLCPGGTQGEALASLPSSTRHLPTVTVPKQNDGVRHGLVRIALYCHAAHTCTGTLAVHARLHHGAHSAGALGQASFSVPSLQTGKVTVRLSSLARRLLPRRSSQLAVEVTVLAAPTPAWTESIVLYRG